MAVTDSIEILWAGESLTVRADRTLFWSAQNTIIFTDPHFGKATTFRAAGIPLPRGTTNQDLSRLQNAMRETQARRVIILGDFFHHKSGQSTEILQNVKAWRRSHKEASFDLILGNHDARSEPVPADWEIKIHPSFMVAPPFVFVHKPDEVKRLGRELFPGLFSMAGHVHPGIRISVFSGIGRTCPCFWFGDRTALLPAFSLFTGCYQIRPRPQDQVVAIAEDRVFQPRTKVI